MTTDNPLLQFLLPEKKIWYNAKIVNLDDERLHEFYSSLPQSISNDNDKLNFFTYFNEDYYRVEKIKKYYDFRVNMHRQLSYEAEITKEEASILLNACLDLYEDIKLKELSELKDLLKERLKEQLRFTVVSLRTHRDYLLKESDWTQIPDIPLDEVDRENWLKYRQTLRDLPENDERWNNSNFLTTLFPIDPITYKMRYPSGEVEYLSTPDQFENEKLQRVFKKIKSFIDELNIPIRTSLDYNSTDYISFVNTVNRALQKIDPELSIDLEVFNVTPLNDEKLSVFENNSIKMQFKFSGITPEILEFLRQKLIDGGQYTEDQIKDLMAILQNFDIHDLDELFGFVN